MVKFNSKPDMPFEDFIEYFNEKLPFFQMQEVDRACINMN